jgi:hypothetical protein
MERATALPKARPPVGAVLASPATDPEGARRGRAITTTGTDPAVTTVTVADAVAVVVTVADAVAVAVTVADAVADAVPVTALRPECQACLARGCSATVAAPVATPVTSRAERCRRDELPARVGPRRQPR